VDPVVRFLHSRPLSKEEHPHDLCILHVGALQFTPRVETSCSRSNSKMHFSSPWPQLVFAKCNILSYLFPTNSEPSGKPIWIDAAHPSKSLSAVQTLSWIKRFAVGLDDLGVAQQQAVMVISPNHIFVPIAFLATVGSKRYFTGANPSYTANELAHQLKVVNAAVLLIHPSLLEVGLAAAEQAAISLHRLFLFSDYECSPTRGLRDWRSMAASEQESSSWRWDALEEDDAAATTIAAINFSSGTTGLPKGVCITHYNLIANASQATFNHFGDATPQIRVAASAERWLAVLPLYHAYSQLFAISIACKLRVSVYVIQKFGFDELLCYIERFKITRLQLVPPILAMMAKRPETSRYDLSSVQHILCGAAPLSSDLQSEITRRFKTGVRQGWGMTETTCSGIMTPDFTNNVPGSIGYLLPNSESRLLDDDGNHIIRDNEPGELWLRGPQIMLGYWNNEEATRESLTPDGWFRTGDVAVVRENRWWIVDRKKELIKVNGLQVAPAELEAVLLKHPDITDAVVVGLLIRDEEFPRAYVVLRDGRHGKIDPETISEFVAGKVAKHKRLSGGVRFVKEVPRLASGKTVRKVVREWAREDANAMATSLKAKI